jgi:adenylate cyclase
MKNLQAYIPQDRLRSLISGEALPELSTGSALFADISGFTPLTEALRDSLGPRRGVEELTHHLDAVYTALISEVEKYDGSVISFAGDAITCWFDNAQGPAALRATACAFGLQSAICAFSAIKIPGGATATLALKVAVASGQVRRFVVGDPGIRRIDVLAGATVARTSTGEHLSQRGDVVLDEATVLALGSALSIREWRTDESGERFAVAEKFAALVTPVERMPTAEIPAERLRAWLHKAQFDRELSFLTEFRPCTVLFVRFDGIDYDADKAHEQLDQFIRQLQRITSEHGGAILQLTIGDKGSYVYVNYGALSSHEDDARRAVKTAIQLQQNSGLQLQMGVTQGVMRVGAYGGQTRRTYGALGDDVNLAARLMMTAAVGEILISGQVYKAVANRFVAEPRSPLPVKGKAEPLPVFAITGERQERSVRLQEPTYALPMVGRARELQHINDMLKMTLTGKGHVIGIVAEAGMGKSRLVAEVIRAAHKLGFVGYGGTCQSDAVNTPYQAWKSIWQAFFGVDPQLSLRKQTRLLEAEIEDKAPTRVDALPLLRIVLDLEIPENDFTKTLEPQFRHSVLRTLLEECLRTAAREDPLLIVIEDLHWIDALSHDLLEELARALGDSPICFVLAYRPPQLERLQAPRLETLPQFTRIELHELTAAEAEQAIRAKLAQLYPARGGALPDGLVETLMARSQGNPFYLEELLNYVHDRGLDPANLHQFELPDSLHTLILSRLDQLTEQEKTTLRVASIVGRLFRTTWLMGYYPQLGTFPQIKAALDTLEALEITPLDSPEPELTYLFKHIVTHEVTYESLPFATRAQLHGKLAAYLEGIGAPVDVIAFHYGRSDNPVKQQEYWLKAGDAAYRAFASEAALEYYGRVSAALLDPQRRLDVELKCASAYTALGRLAEAREHLNLVFTGFGQSLPANGVQLTYGLLSETIRQVWHRVRFARQPVVLETAPPEHESTGSPEGNTFKLIRAYLLLSVVNTLADEAGPLDIYSGLRALNLSEAARRKTPELVQSYGHVGYVSLFLSRSLARAYMQRFWSNLAGLENPSAVTGVLAASNLLAISGADWAEGERGAVQALEICNRLGDRVNWRNNLSLQGYVAGFQGQFDRSLKLFTELYQEGLADNHVQHQAMGLASQSWVLWMRGQFAEALALIERALPLFTVSTGTAFVESAVYGWLASIQVRQGQDALAEQTASKAATLLARAPLPFYNHVLTHANIAEVNLALWERETKRNSTAVKFRARARKACQSLHRLLRWYPIGEPGAWLWQGVCDWQDGKPDSASRSWQRSLAAAQRLGMPYDEALVYYEIGRHATGAERHTNLARAREIFDRLGVTGFEVQ